MKISTDLNVLITEAEWARLVQQLGQQLGTQGYEVSEIHAEAVSLGCEPDNMLLNQYEQEHGHPPVAEVLHRVVIHGETDLGLAEATQKVVACLPEGTNWYGTSLEGHIEPQVTASCQWRPPTN